MWSWSVAADEGVWVSNGAQSRAELGAPRNRDSPSSPGVSPGLQPLPLWAEPSTFLSRPLLLGSEFSPWVPPRAVAGALRALSRTVASNQVPSSHPVLGTLLPDPHLDWPDLKREPALELDQSWTRMASAPGTCPRPQPLPQRVGGGEGPWSPESGPRNKAPWMLGSRASAWSLLGGTSFPGEDSVWGWGSRWRADEWALWGGGAWGLHTDPFSTGEGWAPCV